jgi:hypothetical protein
LSARRQGHIGEASPGLAAHREPQAEPRLRRNLELPKGVLQKNLKTFVYLGAALLVIVTALLRSSGKKTPAQRASAKGQPPQPVAGQHRQQHAGVEEPASSRTSEGAAGDNGRRCIGRSGACVCDAPATSRSSRGLWTDRRCPALYSGPALPASAAGQHADATHACATAGTVDRRQRTRGRLPFRFPI